MSLPPITASIGSNLRRPNPGPLAWQTFVPVGRFWSIFGRAEFLLPAWQAYFGGSGLVRHLGFFFAGLLNLVLDDKLRRLDQRLPHLAEADDARTGLEQAILTTTASATCPSLCRPTRPCSGRLEQRLQDASRFNGQHLNLSARRLKLRGARRKGSRHSCSA
jgi:hypothetical protein